MNLTDQPDYLTVTGQSIPKMRHQKSAYRRVELNAIRHVSDASTRHLHLGAGDSFEVTSVLGDKTGNGDWDGKTLTKLGAGKLTR